MANKNPRQLVASVDKTLPTKYEGTLEPNYYCRGWNAKREKYCKSRAGRKTDHRGVGRCFLHAGVSSQLTHGRYSRLNHERLRTLYEQYAEDSDPLNIEHEIIMLRALFTDFVERHGQMAEALLAWHASFAATQRPLPEDKILAFTSVVDEWEIQLRDLPGDATDKQLADLDTARKFVDLLRGKGILAEKPRQILDIADAHRIIDTLTKAVERIEKIRAANAISRKDLFRVMDQMGRVVMRHVADAELLKKIREGWLDVAL